MGAPAVTFPSRSGSAFVRQVKSEVAGYFEQSQRSSKGGPALWVKTVVLGALVLLPYLAIMSNRLPPLAMLGLAVLMGIGVAGVGFSVSHDALHGAYSGNPAVNYLLGLSFDALGANSYIWKITHNVVHHTYTNIEGVDEDINLEPFVRLSPGTRRRALHAFQHIYAFLIYGLALLFWVFVKDYKYFLRRDLGPYKNLRHPAREVAILVGTKAFYYGWTIALPLLVLDIPWWQFLIGYFTMSITAGIILGVVFQLAHVVEGTDYPVPGTDGDMEHTWLVHQMVTTSNFAPRNRLLSWYVGGLNFQIEHHLFPKICSVHYPALSQIVRKAAAEHGVPYNQHPTFLGAIRSHYRMLKRLGRETEPEPLSVAA